MVVVVDNHLMALPVALTWGKHHGTGIFEHRYQIGDDNCLCEQILVRAEKRRTLPFPVLFVDRIITSMTGPQREMTPVESALDGVGTRFIFDPRFTPMVDFAPRGGLGTDYRTGDEQHKDG